ncbi:DDE-type integrase/transposase/recombinase [Rhizobium sp. BG4]|uniref:DDE-type integrase/transposase/recombinase n=1 Tax=Rhizobium sp. BG4 TaxID=2613770 RepID=UPI00193CB6D9|nr:DDE-type integrase/transposase/recombinase [Rhizobium sp. BG4]QRM42326.1 transposase family protein [Rhizobium sp. BG4]
MSLVRHNDFLKRDNLPVALDIRQLDIPTNPREGEKVQVYSFPKGYRFSIINVERSKIGHFIVVSYAEWNGLGGKFHVQNVASDQPGHLSNWQISQLERQGRFIPHESKQTGRNIETSIALDPEQRKAGERKLDYVVAILREGGKGTVMPKRKLILSAALKHAAKIGDETPPCYNTLKNAIRAYIDNPFNRLLAVAPGKSRGNREHAYCDRLEDLFREAVEEAWSLPKGTALDAREAYEKLLLKQENKDLIPLVTDDEGNIVKPHQSTIERRFYGVDHFTRDVLRKDLETAMRIHDLRIPQLLPTVPLEVVEVDYTELDVTVFDDFYSYIWGRPNIILFRDRMSAGVIGFTVFFGKPSFEAFLHGFKQAVYPKDMSEYPGLDWTMHGLMSVLVVDADTHLQSDNMRAFCDEIGVTLHEVRPGEPNSKGGLERTIRTLNDSLIHNLPGTTLSNVVRRKEGGKEKELGQPKITFSELVKHITAWV